MCIEAIEQLLVSTSTDFNLIIFRMGVVVGLQSAKIIFFSNK